MCVFKRRKRIKTQVTEFLTSAFFILTQPPYPSSVWYVPGCHRIVTFRYSTLHYVAALLMSVCYPHAPSTFLSSGICTSVTTAWSTLAQIFAQPVPTCPSSFSSNVASSAMPFLITILISNILTVFYFLPRTYCQYLIIILLLYLVPWLLSISYQNGNTVFLKDCWISRVTKALNTSRAGT